ncbi:hypothetical protein SAMN06272771_4571 [Streptomyces sp. Ag82_O1-12]|uniref:hypothetical protein n=1 Tax=unclassified Streptomyces TaxID=2593676 RepID=UPI000BD9B5F5|nr:MULTISPECIES: hypothetical protein [unclassified Streptomyces]SMQ18132.1 hypothetical protein SAMN06272771_4571 [Streptomyces sp. Ag82_O1-12]SOD47169.1 hypothetical protein SAMN06272727_4571 [Streptomyces sp. Ag82_G6-1]
MPRDAREASSVSEGEKVKYPFAVDGRWALRHQIPYTVEHDGRTYQVLASVFAEPSVHGRVRIGCEGRPVGEFDGLTLGDVLDITGDRWRVVGVDYRTRIVLEQVIDGCKEDTGVQPGK